MRVNGLTIYKCPSCGEWFLNGRSENIGKCGHKKETRIMDILRREIWFTEGTPKGKKAPFKVLFYKEDGKFLFPPEPETSDKEAL